jgi:hypothetical protein
MTEGRKTRRLAEEQKITAIAQCGFREMHQNQAAWKIMRQFAEESGFA